MKVLVFQLFGGILSGLVATLFLYILRTKWSLPQFLISEQIAEDDGTYSFKIQNMSKHTFSNIKIRITYRTKTRGCATFNYDKVPTLHGKNESDVEETYYGMYEDEIKIEQVRLRKKTSYTSDVSKKNDLEAREQQRKEPINVFFNNNKDGVLEIVITYDDHHKVFGTVQRIITKQYKDITCISMDSQFVPGQLTPVANKKKKYTDTDE